MYILYMYLVLWNVYSEINISYLILSYLSVLVARFVMYSLGNAPIYQVFLNKTSSIALLTRFIWKLKNLGIVQDIKISDK